MIYTVTLNPSVDFITHVAKFRKGGINYSFAESMNAGGRAINVSRFLTDMNVPTTATGFVGGRTGAFIKDELDRVGIRHDFIETSVNTRLNLSLFIDKSETRILGPGEEISLEEINSLMFYLSRVREGDFLVLAGSLPPGMSPDIYSRMVEIARVNGAFFLPIIAPVYLKDLISKKPLLITPSLNELAALFDVNLTNKEDAAPYALECIKMGAENVIVNLERKGSLFVNKDLEIYESSGPDKAIISSTYTNTALVSGFIGSFMRTNDPLDSFKMGQAVSNATYYVDSLPDEKGIDEALESVTILPYA